MTWNTFVLKIQGESNHPKSFGSFEKRAPGNEYRTLWKTFAKITNFARCQVCGLGIVFLCISRDITGNLSKDGVNDAPRLGVNLWNSIHHQMRKLLEKRFKSSNEKQLLQPDQDEDEYAGVLEIIAEFNQK